MKQSERFGFALFIYGIFLISAEYLFKNTEKGLLNEPDI